MAMVQIRDLDDDVKRTLDLRARAHHRSTSAEAAAILTEAVCAGGGPRARRALLLRTIADQAVAWPEALPPVEELVAEDRRR